MTSEEKKRLRSRAHSLKPVIMIGQAGLSAAVIAEIESALNSHELIKIKIQSDDRDIRKQISTEICDTTHCSLIQNIGKISVVYRKNPNK